MDTQCATYTGTYQFNVEFALFRMRILLHSRHSRRTASIVTPSQAWKSRCQSYLSKSSPSNATTGLQCQYDRYSSQQGFFPFNSPFAHTVELSNNGRKSNDKPQNRSFSIGFSWGSKYFIKISSLWRFPLKKKNQKLFYCVLSLKQ